MCEEDLTPLTWPLATSSSQGMLLAQDMVHSAEVMLGCHCLVPGCRCALLQIIYAEGLSLQRA